MITPHLNNYIQNSNDAQANFWLGYEYEQQGQTGAAISFYLRTAERATTDIEQYEALLRCALCFEKQQTRDNTEKVLLEKAISLLVHRPEAYFLLSRLYEMSGEWQDCYTISCIGLAIANFNSPSLSTHVDYPGKYALTFQKGAAAWWAGHCDESREIMADLKFNCPEMSPIFLQAVNNNLASIGYPHTISSYDISMLEKIRFQFNNIDQIKKNYSQCYQDMFVLAANNGKKKGRYLEVGSAEPFKNNNTALLETQFGWRGISFDINPKLVNEFLEQRSNLVFCADATQVNYSQLINTAGLGDQTDFDYLQVDCDPPWVSFEILKKIPFDQFRFAAITFEHDYYVDPAIKEKSREFLKSKGYKLLVSDIAYNQVNSFEDWWIHPELVSTEIQQKLQDTSPNIKYAKNYMFPN